eukprot:6179042-Pleurochrysis_carterae.AAC.8
MADASTPATPGIGSSLEVAPTVGRHVCMPFDRGMKLSSVPLALPLASKRDVGTRQKSLAAGAGTGSGHSRIARPVSNTITGSFALLYVANATINLNYLARLGEFSVALSREGTKSVCARIGWSSRMDKIDTLQTDTRVKTANVHSQKSSGERHKL